MKIGDFELNLKIIFIGIFALIVIFGFMSLMGNSSDITVYGVNFHVPDGYNEIEQEEVDNAVGESYTLSNKEFHDAIFITVTDTNATDINQITFNYPAIKQYQVIDGKDGLLAMTSSPTVRNHFLYIEDGKLVHINAPFTDVQNELHNEDVIAEIIK